MHVSSWGISSEGQTNRALKACLSPSPDTLEEFVSRIPTITTTSAEPLRLASAGWINGCAGMLYLLRLVSAYYNSTDGSAPTLGVSKWQLIERILEDSEHWKHEGMYLGAAHGS